MATLTSIVDLVELDLADGTNALLGAADYQAHVTRATKEFSRVWPQRTSTYLSIERECHKVTDSANTIAADSATTQATANTLLTEIKDDYELHRASTTYHKAADTTNTIAAADATDLATSIALANELKTDINAHYIQNGVHYTNDITNRITSENAVDLATVLVLANELKNDYTNHLSEYESGRDLYIGSGVTDQTGFMEVEGIEYPNGKFYERNEGFTRDGDWIRIHTDDAPAETGELVKVFYQYAHLVDGSGSTLPVEEEDTIRLGAGGYAMLEIAEKRRTSANNTWGTGEQYHLTTTDASVDKNFQDYIEEADARFANFTTRVAAGVTALSAFATHMGNFDTQLAAGITKITTGADAHDADMTLARAELEIAEAGLAEIDGLVTAADAYLDTGDDKIPTVNVGGNEAGAYAQYASMELRQAQVKNSYSRAQIALARGMAAMAAAERAATTLYTQAGMAELSAARNELNLAASNLRLGQGEVSAATNELQFAMAQLRACGVWARWRNSLLAMADRYDREGNRKVKQFKDMLDKIRLRRLQARRPVSAFVQIFED